MISITDLRAGRAFKLNGEFYQVVQYKHTKLGRGKANIKVKVRSLITDKVTDKTFISGAQVEPLETETRLFQFLYRDANKAYFMNPRSFEQISLLNSVLGKKIAFLKEGSQVKILFAEDEPLSVELPTNLAFQVVKAPPGVKGDSVTASSKKVTLDNGLEVSAPLFIKEGDWIKIETQTGTYVERSK